MSELKPVAALHFPDDQAPVHFDASMLPVDASIWNFPTTHCLQIFIDASHHVPARQSEACTGHAVAAFSPFAKQQQRRVCPG